jgi:hypothetical protein
MSAHDPIAVLRSSKLRIAAQLRHLVVAILLLLLLAASAHAQLPDTLLHAILPDRKTLQIGAQLGYTIAISGEYAVLGTPFDLSADTSGVVKVFDSATGALRHVLHAPNPATDGNFGYAVAISGARLVVGAIGSEVNGLNTGTVYVYDLAGVAPSIPVLKLDNPQGTDLGHFGVAVAISGSRMVIGANANDVGEKREAGNVYVYDLDSVSPAVPVAVVNNPEPQEDDGFGASIAIDGTRIVVGTPNDQTVDGTAGSVYVYDLADAAPTVPVMKVQNPNGSVNDQFGASVGISGSRIVVGAPLANLVNPAAGGVFVYDLDSPTRTVPVATVPNPTAATFDTFGRSVAIVGTHVVVGDPTDDDTGAKDSGCAYLYDLASATPTVPVVMLNNPSAAGEKLGWAAAMDGTRILVSALGSDTGAIDAGSAYVYDTGATKPEVPVAILNHPGAATQNRLGSTVAISGSLMVVGAPLYDAGGRDAGSAFIYDLSSPTPTAPLLELDNPSPRDTKYFGTTVAISGHRVVVGEPFGSFPNSYGSAYVYDLDSATPTVPILALAKPLPQPGHRAPIDKFGFSVAISGTRVVIGAPNDRSDPMAPGAVYVFDLGGAAPATPVATLRSPLQSQTSSSFGYSVAISGPMVAIGSPYDSDFEGSAYVYDFGTGTSTAPVGSLHKPNTTPGDLFGWSVAISGRRLIVGAPGDSTQTFYAGGAYVYDVTGKASPKPPFRLPNPTPVAREEFGYSVSISGSIAVVASPSDSVGGILAGSACVFDLNSATPTIPAVTLYNPHPAEGDGFSSAVAIDGTAVAIGTPGDDTVRPGHGAVYVFGPNPNAAPPTPADGLLTSWKLTHFGTTAGHGPFEDDDRDGLNNLLEEAFNTDPLKPDATAAPAVVNEAGYLTITIAKHPGVTYQVQSAATPDESAFSPGTTTILLDTPTTLKVRDNFLVGTTPGRFMRVKVTATP